MGRLSGGAALVALLPMTALAQAPTTPPATAPSTPPAAVPGAVTLPEVVVVGTTPVLGSGVDRDKVPGNVHVLNRDDVKVVGTPIGDELSRRLRALYFTRATAPHGDGPLYHHIGIYAFRRAALERFVALPPSPLELREKLEQLRALENGMRIDVALVDTVPLGVDTPADLERARQLLAPTRDAS